jgi:pentapeptide MXKDX repeat protein
MTKFHIIPLAMAMSIALTCVSFAQGTMAPQGSGTTTTTPSGSMAKPDTMGKTDGMKKDDMSKDGMKKKDDMSKDGMKKDGMSK